MKTRSHPKVGPSFIGVGPERTGTTWIYQQLRKHPKVQLPPIKELRYFWEKENFPNENVFSRMNTKVSWHRKQYAEYAKERYKNLVHSPKTALFTNFNRLLWDLRYLVLPHDDRWYLSCFQTSKESISGEISPQYFFLPETRIRKISTLLPHCKILISLRRPIDWVWSFADLISRNGFLQDKYGNVDAFIDSKITACSYSKALANWKEAYSDSQILILFYEHLRNDPWQYYKRICDFLEIFPDADLESGVKRRVNPGSQKPPPEWVAKKIKAAWREDIQELTRMVPDVPASWFE